MLKKVFILLINLLILINISACTNNKTKATDTIILFTNDVLGNIDNFAKIKEYKDQLISEYGEANVTLVDIGNALYGTSLASYSGGSYIVKVMNNIGYNLASIAPKDLAYGIDKFMQIAEVEANFTYLSSNLTDRNGDDMLDSYKVIDYKGRRIAFIGIISPNTINQVDLSTFVDNDDNYLYDFYASDDASKFYERIQNIIDNIKENENPDYIIALANLAKSDDIYSSNNLIANTTGIDILIDGSSNSSSNEVWANKDGDATALVRGDNNLNTIGSIHISSNDDIDISFVDISDINDNQETKEFISDIKSQYSDEIQKVIATSDIELLSIDDGYRLIDHLETNLGDFITDATRISTSSDIALLPSSLFSDNLQSGDIRYEDILNILKEDVSISKVLIQGQDLITYLEYYASQYENEVLLQISGIKYTIDLTNKTNVHIEEETLITKEDEEGRIKEVFILNNETDEYEMLNLNSYYELVSTKDVIDEINNYLKNTNIITNDFSLISKGIYEYLIDECNGEIDEAYNSRYGERRIIIEID